MDEQNEKKNEPSSVFIDIAKQTRDEILIPRLLDTANTAASQTIYGIADYITNCIARQIFRGKNAPVMSKNGDDRTKFATKAKTTAPIISDSGSRSSVNLQYVVIETNNPSDRLDASDIDGRKKAEYIKNELVKKIRLYGKVRVSDLYDLSGKIKPVVTDYNFGWTNVNDIHYTRNSDGWFFNMPNPTRLV